MGLQAPMAAAASAAGICAVESSEWAERRAEQGQGSPVRFHAHRLQFWSCMRGGCAARGCVGGSGCERKRMCREGGDAVVSPTVGEMVQMTTTCG